MHHLINLLSLTNRYALVISAIAYEYLRNAIILAGEDMVYNLGARGSFYFRLSPETHPEYIDIICDIDGNTYFHRLNKGAIDDYHRLETVLCNFVVNYSYLKVV